MVCTRRVEYNGRVVIVIGVDILRLLQRFYVIAPASVAVIIIIVAIFIIFYRDIVLVSLFIVWFGVGNFMLQYIKYFQSDGGLPRKPPDQLENASGEQYRGPRKASDYVLGVKVEELVAALTITSVVELQRLDRPGLHEFYPIVMGVGILSTLEEAMFGELDGLGGNHGLRSKCSRNAVLDRESVEP